MALDNFENNLHALAGGAVMAASGSPGFRLEPIIDDDGDFTPSYLVVCPGLIDTLRLVFPDLPDNLRIVLRLDPLTPEKEN